MSLKARVLALVKRYGEPAKFAARMVLGAVIPGSPALVELAGQALDCAHQAAKDQWDLDVKGLPQMTPGEEGRLAEALGLLAGDLGSLVAQVAPLSGLPEQAQRVLDASLQHGAHLDAALARLQDLAAGMDRVEQGQRRLLVGQGYAAGMLEEILPLVRRLAGVAEGVQELRAAGVAPEEFGTALTAYREACRAAAAGDLDAARNSLVTARHLAPGAGSVEDLASRLTRATRMPGGGATPALELRPGEALDGWRLEALVGQGGMGQVWRAKKGGEVRALKVIRPAFGADERAAERFRREIRALCGLPAHKNLVRMDDFGHAGDRWYLVMELLEGETLERRLARQGALSVEAARQVIGAVADGLAACHERGILHRDIKPANVVFRADGAPVLADFGLARPEGAPQATLAGGPGYTPGFAAPEQIAGDTTTARTDVWALGATLYYAVARQRPDQADPEDYPRELAEVLRRSLARNPQRRFAHAGEYRSALRGAVPPARRARLSRPEVPGFRWLREETFECGGQRHTVAIYRHALFARAMGLAEGATDLACEFVLVPTGEFQMGSKDWDAAQPVHRVAVPSFLLARTPVTQAVWDGVARLIGTSLADERGWRGPKLPIEGVSWDDVQPFLEAAGLRLPSEAEWEYACRAGTSTRWSFGSQEAELGKYAWYDDNSGKRTHRVGQKLFNAFGLLDMHGNVWEWCQDVGHDDYTGAPDDGSAWEGGGDGVRLRAYRGGSWDDSAVYARSADRFRFAPGTRGANLGLRAAAGVPRAP